MNDKGRREKSREVRDALGGFKVLDLFGSRWQTAKNHFLTLQ